MTVFIVFIDDISLKQLTNNIVNYKEVVTHQLFDQPSNSNTRGVFSGNITTVLYVHTYSIYRHVDAEVSTYKNE